MPLVAPSIPECSLAPREQVKGFLQGPKRKARADLGPAHWSGEVTLDLGGCNPRTPLGLVCSTYPPSFPKPGAPPTVLSSTQFCRVLPTPQPGGRRGGTVLPFIQRQSCSFCFRAFTIVTGTQRGPQRDGGQLQLSQQRLGSGLTALLQILRGLQTSRQRIWPPCRCESECP